MGPSFGNITINHPKNDAYCTWSENAHRCCNGKGIHSSGISNGCASSLGWGGILYRVLRHRKFNWYPFKMLDCSTAPLSCPTFYKCQLFSFQFNCMWLQRWSSLLHYMWSELDCSRGVNEIGLSIANHLWKLAHNHQQCHQQEHKEKEW